MELSKPLRSLSTAARIFKDDGPRGVLWILGRKAIEMKKEHDFRKIIQQESLRDRFAEIDKRGFWYSLTNRETRSGEGSTRAFTRPYVEALSSFLDEIRPKNCTTMTFLDAPCGDFNWIQPVAARHDLCYIGADIVPSIIVRNNRKYASETIRFIEFDITSGAFPDATVWHCRDCLIHLSFSNIIRCFANFAGSKIEYALLTCHHLPEDGVNLDVVDGGFRLLDLRKPPLVLPPPICTIPDSLLQMPRFTHVYTREQIAGWLA